jgi:hypothetical protein
MSRRGSLLKKVACAASGKAGGFLALDWCAGSPLDALARRSFALHAELAARIDDHWSYRRMTAYGGFVARDSGARRHEPAALDWLSADATVIAMGPWSMLAAEWAPLPQVFGQQSPSLVYDTGTDVPADALFLEFRDAPGDELTVEVFPRADGSTHVCAFSGAAPLPADPADVAPDPDAIERLRSLCERLSPAFRPERIIAKQACFRRRG